jgi:hypothetical protein
MGCLLDAIDSAHVGGRAAVSGGGALEIAAFVWVEAVAVSGNGARRTTGGRAILAGFSKPGL